LVINEVIFVFTIIQKTMFRSTTETLKRFPTTVTFPRQQVRNQYSLMYRRDPNNFDNPFNVKDYHGEWHNENEFHSQFCSNKFCATRICPSLCLSDDQITSSAEPLKPVKQEPATSFLGKIPVMNNRKKMEQC
jgi:hypothetical protein